MRLLIPISQQVCDDRGAQQHVQSWALVKVYDSNALGVTSSPKPCCLWALQFLLVRVSGNGKSLVTKWVKKGDDDPSQSTWKECLYSQLKTLLHCTCTVSPALHFSSLKPSAFFPFSPIQGFFGGALPMSMWGFRDRGCCMWLFGQIWDLGFWAIQNKTNWIE